MLSRRTRLAIAAVVDVALRARSKPLPSKLLAARHDLAPRQFESLLQALVRAKILKSLRGPRGGYELARERRRISLGDIVRALEDDEAESPASVSAVGFADTVIEPVIAKAASAFLAELDHVSVGDLCQRAETLDAAADQDTADFAI